jgi:hypothetical protein
MRRYTEFSIGSDKNRVATGGVCVANAGDVRGGMGRM